MLISVFQIGKIKEMVRQKKGNEAQVLFQWFYRPEESSGGRKVRFLLSPDVDVHLCLL